MKTVSATAMVFLLAGGGAAAAAEVVTYHNSNTRQGAYIEPKLTLAAAATMTLNTAFNPSLNGHIYAQPLFWHPKSAATGEVIVVTESNQVAALNSITGATLWSVQLPAAVPSSALGCGNVNPEGIHGTPVIDPATGTLYLDALVEVNGAPNHTLYALSVTNGAILSGWPVNVDAALKAQGVSFTAHNQGERSGALVYGGNLYVTYGGRYGDCDPYYGTVIQVNPATRALVGHWQTRAMGGGIWSQGGISSDGKSLFVTTGNTMNTSTWAGGEAILRLRPGLAASTSTADYFTPSDWLTLDQQDKDLGGTEAIPLNIRTSGGKVAGRVIAFGKDGNAYLADRANLGGIGGQLATAALSGGEIITAPAVYETAASSSVAFTNNAAKSPCSGNVINMIKVAASGSAPISTSWCAAYSGDGSPIITTTDGTKNAIVWVLGAEGDNMLHGYNATTGAVVFNGGGITLQGLHHFQTLIAAEGSLYVAADGRLYSYVYTKG